MAKLLRYHPLVAEDIWAETEGRTLLGCSGLKPLTKWKNPKLKRPTSRMMFRFSKSADNRGVQRSRQRPDW